MALKECALQDWGWGADFPDVTGTKTRPSDVGFDVYGGVCVGKSWRLQSSLI